jgi:probable DNA repair protein
MEADLLRSLGEGATVVTPNRRLARDLKRRFDAAQSAAGREVWPTPDILPLGAWLERSFAELTRFDVNQRLLTPTQELALWHQAIGDSPYADALLDTAATAGIAHQAWRVQQGWRVDLAAFGAALSEDSKAFSAWSARFCEVCSARHWLDGARLADAVGERVRLDARGMPREIALHGFDELSPQEHDLLAACRASGMRVTERRSGRARGQAVVRVYMRSEDEFADAARRARDILAADPAARIGVVVPGLAGCRSDVVRLFDDILEPSRILPSSRGSPRPYNVSLGLPLSRYPLVRAALSILRLARGKLPLEDVGSLLRGPFVAGGELEFTRRALLDAKLRSMGRLDVSVEALRAQAHGRHQDDAYACRVLSARLEAWRPHAVEARGARQPPSSWSSTFLALLSGLGWPGERTLDSEDYQTFQKWRELVSGLSALDPVLGSLRYDDALDWLVRLSAETLFQPETENVPIQVLGVLESAGIEFDHLFVTGLHDEAWPDAVRPNPLLPVALQRARRVPHAGAEWELGFARRMTALWLSSAQHIALSHPAADGDRALRRSPLLVDIPVAEPDISRPRTGGSAGSATGPGATYAETVRGSVRLERLTDAVAPPLEPGHLVTGGAAVFGNQSACPFRAFAIHRLGAKGLEEGRPGLDARERGNLLHRTLSHLWGELESQAGLLSMRDEDLHAAIERAVDAAVGWLRQRRPDALSESFAGLERARLQLLIWRFLDLEKQRTAFRVVHREEPRNVDIGGLRVAARIDRIDQLDDFSRVIVDYKTGQASPSGWMGERPDDPQLPLYAVTDAGPVAAVSFAVLRAEEVAFKGLGREADLLPGVGRLDQTKSARHIPSWGGLFETWRAELEALAREFLAGHAAVEPKDYPRTCEFCDLGALCRVKESLDRGPVPPEGDADD